MRVFLIFIVTKFQAQIQPQQKRLQQRTQVDTKHGFIHIYLPYPTVL